jgi:hypothetical protein
MALEQFFFPSNIDDAYGAALFAVVADVDVFARAYVGEGAKG